MVNTIENQNITVDGNTVELTGEVEATDEYTTLRCEAENSIGKYTVVYTLQSDTPTSTLEDIFNSEFTVTPAGTAHKLLVETDTHSVVYSDASLEE